MDYAPAGYEDEPWYQVTEGVGYNYNFTDIQAALGLAQLDRIREFKAQRDMIIESYNAAFEEIPGIRTPPDPVESDPMRHLYAIEVNEEFGCDRKEFINAMHAENLGVQVHYVPLHYHPYFQEEFGYEEGMFPVAEDVYDKLVSMPLHAEMNREDIEKVVQAVERLHRYHN
jgi:dTDP-4-amino-4,6-dideoxygalactose transaminase